MPQRCKICGITNPSIISSIDFRKLKGWSFPKCKKGRKHHEWEGEIGL